MSNQTTSVSLENPISATDAYVEEGAVISIQRQNPAYTHAVRYRFGGLTGYIGPDGILSSTPVLFTETTVIFPIPESFWEEMYDTTSSSCKLYYETYENGVRVGETTTTTFTVWADPVLCAPIVSGTVQDVNEKTVALTGDAGVLVKFMSDALCVIQAEGQYHAEINETTVEGNEDTESYLYRGVQKNTFSFYAIDSRFFRTDCTVTVPMVPYFYPTANCSVKRPDPTADQVELTVRGVFFSGSFGAAVNTLQAVCILPDGSQVALTPVSGEGTYSISAVLGGLSFEESHSLQIRVWDALSEVNSTVTVRKGLPVFQWGQDHFQVNVPACISGVHMQTLAVNGESIEVTFGKSLFVCGGQTLGFLYRDSGDNVCWWGTEEGSFYDRGDVVFLFFPDLIRENVLFLSGDGFTVQNRG